jgi:hypothetical protein
VHRDLRQVLLVNLLKLRADANLLDTHGRSPLWYASKAGAVSLVSILLEYGANPDIQDFTSLSALEAAQKAMGGAFVVPMEDAPVQPQQGQEVLDWQDALEEAHSEIALNAHIIEEIRSQLQRAEDDDETTKMNVTGAWRLKGTHTVLVVRQDPINGSVRGEFVTKGKPDLALQGQVLKDEFIIHAGPKHAHTTFRLHPSADGQILIGRWEDFRGGSGHSEMHAVQTNV